MNTKVRPLIGITTDLCGTPNGQAGNHEEPISFLPRRYSRAIERAGGVAVLLPATGNSAVIREYMGRLDGLMLSGGNFDIHPNLYGEAPAGELGAIKQDRTEFELELSNFALKRNFPVLGICGGAQLINVALGGSLYQDIAAQLPHAGEHQQSAKRAVGGHPIQIHPGTRLRQIVKRSTLEVNTTHHQAVKRLGKGLVVNATAPAGVIEGIESTDHTFVLGVQWHPEALAPRFALQRRIFSFFVEICSHR